MNQPPRRGADILVCQITAFDLNGWFVCNRFMVWIHDRILEAFACHEQTE